MAQQVDLLHDDQRRKKLSSRTGVLLVVLFLLPIAASFFLNTRAPQLFQPYALATAEKPAAEITKDGQQCYQTTENIQRNSLVGIRVLDLTYTLTWCADANGISTVDVQEVTHSALGKWTIEEPTVDVLEKTDTTAVVDIHRSISRHSILQNFGDGGSYRYTLHTDGTAE